MIARYVRDFLFEASSEELYQKYYNDIPQNVYTQIIKADPTSTDRKNGKYCKWLLDLYKNKKLLIEDLYKATEYLILFNKYGSKLQKNQIQMYKSLPDLFIEIKQFQKQSPKKDLMSNKEKYRDIKENQTEKIYEDDEWLVLVPKTKKSSCFWGQGTQWCTAAKTNNAFKDYNTQGPLYIIISKKMKDDEGYQIKYQFHFESGSFMNSNDNNITKEDYNLFNKDLKLFIKTKINSASSAYFWAQTIGDKEEMKDITLKSNDPEYAYKWAKDIGDREEMKQIILNGTNLDSAYWWANVDSAYWWAKTIGDREEMKQIILKSNDPEYAYYWAKAIGDKEEMKQIILNNNNLRYVVKWAKYISDREEMKSIILKADDPEYAFLWASDIGDREEMKPIIYKSDKYKKYWNLFKRD